MDSPLSFPINSSTVVGGYTCELGIYTFDALAHHVHSIPYGRPISSSAIAVLVENRGTCSSKHRLLATVAHESGHAEINLMVGIYEMSESNTPGVGATLARAEVAAIPEAHCYLMLNGVRHDFTGLEQGGISPFDTLMEEYQVMPSRLAKIKDHIHRRVLGTWAFQAGMTSDRAWQIREACIAALASNKRFERTPHE